MELANDLVKSGKAYSRAKIGVSHPTEIDSQERILRNESPERYLSQSKGLGILERNITRTDEVTVSYSSGWREGR